MIRKDFVVFVVCMNMEFMIAKEHRRVFFKGFDNGDKLFFTYCVFLLC